MKPLANRHPLHVAGTLATALKLAACGSGALIISLLQREGGRRLTAAEFLAGHSLKIGEKLGPVGA